MKKIRLIDLLLKHFPDILKKEHYARILAGEYRVAGERIKDPKQPVPIDVEIRLEAKPFVSRGGAKLQAAIEDFSVDVTGKTFLDAGASSGGFTDCLLKNGAVRVHAVDIAYGQLDYSLRQDRRVIVHERTNIMGLEGLEPPADAAVADLSFRSLNRAASKIISLCREGWAILLVKPQFEWKDPPPDFSGVVKDRSDAEKILRELLESLEAEELLVHRMTLSPISGLKGGNREFFFLVSNGMEKAKKALGGAGFSALEILRQLEYDLERSLGKAFPV